MRVLMLIMKLDGWGGDKTLGRLLQGAGRTPGFKNFERSITHVRSIGCFAKIDSDVTNVTVLVTKSKNEPVYTGMSRIPVSDVSFP